MKLSKGFTKEFANENNKGEIGINWTSNHSRRAHMQYVKRSVKRKMQVLKIASEELGNTAAIFWLLMSACVFIVYGLLSMPKEVCGDKVSLAETESVSMVNMIAVQAMDVNNEQLVGVASIVKVGLKNEMGTVHLAVSWKETDTQKLLGVSGGECSSVTIAPISEISKEERNLSTPESCVSGQLTASNGAVVLFNDRWDYDYVSESVYLDAENRELVERLVQGESGNQGFEGAVLVAQTIRDTMISDNCFDLMEIKKSHGYAGTLDIEPNGEVLRAVEFVFDEGGCGVHHKLKYFYSAANMPGNISVFHESQDFIIEYRDHKFFNEWDSK